MLRINFLSAHATHAANHLFYNIPRNDLLILHVPQTNYSIQAFVGSQDIGRDFDALEAVQREAARQVSSHCTEQGQLLIKVSILFPMKVDLFHFAPSSKYQYCYLAAHLSGGRAIPGGL